MPTITFDSVSKSYQNNQVIESFNASVPDKDFLVLLGPSGCGKSTMLRMIGGITDVTSGAIRFDDQTVNNLTPRQRNIAFVFQSYALYPHMSVRANIGFPLIMDQFRWWHHTPILGAIQRKSILESPRVKAKIEEVAEMLELTPYLERRPKALSGGQRQRVALARSLVREPSVYLLDEPLSNLDAKLRTQMRAEIATLHKRVQKTFIYVTHDQVEAMTMGTRIIVLNDGVVQQYGEPKEIYDRPSNEFVAKFIGSPPMNIMDVSLSSEGVELDGHLLVGSKGISLKARQTSDGNLRLGIRAENIEVSDEPLPGSIPAAVSSVEHLGAETIVGFRISPAIDQGTTQKMQSTDVFFAKLAGDRSLTMGQTCHVQLDLTTLSWFDTNTGGRVEL